MITYKGNSNTSGGGWLQKLAQGLSNFAWRNNAQQQTPTARNAQQQQNKPSWSYANGQQTGPRFYNGHPGMQSSQVRQAAAQNAALYNFAWRNNPSRINPYTAGNQRVLNQQWAQSRLERDTQNPSTTAHRNPNGLTPNLRYGAPSSQNNPLSPSWEMVDSGIPGIKAFSLGYMQGPPQELQYDAPSQDYGGGGGSAWGGWDNYGGGGNYNWQPDVKANELWNNLLSWTINQPNGA